MEDYQFSQYKKKHKFAYSMIIFISFSLSLHFFRLLFCKLFSLDSLFASATQPGDFYRPLTMYSMLHMCVVLGPMIMVNTYGVFVTIDGFWDN